MTAAKRLGDRLRKARVAAGMSAPEVAKHFNRHQQTVYRAEWGEIEPSLNALRAYARLYRVNWDWLVTGKEPSGLGVTDAEGADTRPKPAA